MYSGCRGEWIRVDPWLLFLDHRPITFYNSKLQNNSFHINNFLLIVLPQLYKLVNSGISYPKFQVLQFQMEFGIPGINTQENLLFFRENLDREKILGRETNFMKKRGLAREKGLVNEHFWYPNKTNQCFRVGGKTSMLGFLLNNVCTVCDHRFLESLIFTSLLRLLDKRKYD